MSEPVKIRYRVGTVGIKAGEEHYVSEELADLLVSQHHASRVYDLLDLEIDLGTVEGVLSEVGEDKAKARAALDAEQARGDAARVTLIAKLDAILAD